MAVEKMVMYMLYVWMEDKLATNLDLATNCLMLSAVARPSGTVLPRFFLSWVRTVAFSCSFSTISSVMPVTSWLSPAPPCSMAAAWLAACIWASAHPPAWARRQGSLGRRRGSWRWSWVGPRGS